MQTRVSNPYICMNILLKMLLWGRNFFFPGACVLCNKSLISIDEIKYNLCDDCKPSLNVIQGQKCRYCGKPLISEEEICVPCRKISDINDEKIDDRNSCGTSELERRFFDRLWVLFPYIGRFKKILTFYKFKKVLSLAEFFCDKIIDCIKENPVLHNAVIVPVPPRKGKIKHSGWDQVDYLVKRLKKNSSGIKIIKCLKRKKSKIQKHLNRKDRIENLKDRIYIYKDAPETVLIIDDVITTGSTLEVCAKTLKEAGSKTVYGLCLFYD